MLVLFRTRGLLVIMTVVLAGTAACNAFLAAAFLVVGFFSPPVFAFVPFCAGIAYGSYRGARWCWANTSRRTPWIAPSEKDLRRSQLRLMAELESSRRPVPGRPDVPGGSHDHSRTQTHSDLQHHLRLAHGIHSGGGTDELKAAHDAVHLSERTLTDGGSAS
jgi:hypothetical protein